MSKFSQTLFSSARKTRSAFSWMGSHVALLNVTMVFLVTVLALCQVVQANQAATKGYRIRDLETKISSLKLETQQLELSIAETRSLAAVTRNVQMLGMVKAGVPAYVRSAPAVVTYNR
ncbi:hypothetical protein HY734_02465 [Candidatus Uhrbacteria bacterium]|nr:hypothetical protein [Candidatus Uhrbacteria bacterium]